MSKETESTSRDRTMQIGDVGLNFQPFIADRRKIEVDQILRQAGYNPTLEHRLVELTYPGTKSWDNDETIILKPGKERHFIVGKLDRLMAMAIDDIVYELPFTKIGEPELRKIACVPDEKILVLSRKDKPDLPLETDTKVNLNKNGVERIHTSEPRAVNFWLNGTQKSLKKGRYSFIDIVKLAYPNAIFGGDKCYTVGWDQGPRGHEAGELFEGDNLRIIEGVIIDVSATDKS